LLRSRSNIITPRLSFLTFENLTVAAIVAIHIGRNKDYQAYDKTFAFFGPLADIPIKSAMSAFGGKADMSRSATFANTIPRFAYVRNNTRHMGYCAHDRGNQPVQSSTPSLI